MYSRLARNRISCLACAHSRRKTLQCVGFRVVSTLGLECFFFDLRCVAAAFGIPGAIPDIEALGIITAELMTRWDE